MFVCASGTGIRITRRIQKSEIPILSYDCVMIQGVLDCYPPFVNSWNQNIVDVYASYRLI